MIPGLLDLDYPGPHEKFCRDIMYVVGHYVGNSFRVDRTCYSKESAVSARLNLQQTVINQNYDMYDYFCLYYVYEIRLDISLLC